MSNDTIEEARKEAIQAVMDRLENDGKGLVKRCHHNLQKIVTFDAAASVWHLDCFRDMLRRVDTGRVWRDEDARLLQVHISFTYGVDWQEGVVESALRASALERGTDSLMFYLENLPAWDGIDRIASFLTVACGAKDERITRIYSRLFFLAAVARGMRPPGLDLRIDEHGRRLDKVDTMLILIGTQGTHKSQVLEALVPVSGWFLESPLELRGASDRLETAKKLTGKWIVEVQEVDGMLRTRAAPLKAFLSTSTDTYRASYARNPLDYPRRCVMVGTSNTPDLLHDKTGNRRFWPLMAGECDPQYVRANRDQLWAEAVHLYREGCPWWLTTEQEEAQAEATLDYVIADAAADAVQKGLDSLLGTKLRDGFTVQELMSACATIPGAPTRARDVGETLRALGFEPSGRVRNKRTWRKRRPT